MTVKELKTLLDEFDDNQLVSIGTGTDLLNDVVDLEDVISISTKLYGKMCVLI